MIAKAEEEMKSFVVEQVRRVLKAYDFRTLTPIGSPPAVPRLPNVD